MYSYENAIKFLMTEFGLKRYQLEAIFHCAGSTKHPFGPRKWKDLPAVVLDNIRHIETTPPDIGPDGYFHYYQDARMHNWLRAERQNIKAASQTTATTA